MKKQIYRSSFQTVTLLVIVLTGYAAVVLGIIFPDPETPMGSSWDGIGGAIIVLLSPFFCVSVIFIVFLLFVLLRSIASYAFKSYSEDKQRIIAFALLVMLLISLVYVSVPKHFINPNEEVVVEWHENGKKKVSEYYYEGDNGKVLSTRINYNNWGSIIKQEKLNGKLVFKVSDNILPYNDPCLVVTGINLTRDEFKIIEHTGLPATEFPKNAFDINYRLSYTDFPHEEYSLNVYYKLTGVDPSSIKNFNTRADTNGHANISGQKLLKLGADTLLVSYEKCVW